MTAFDSRMLSYTDTFGVRLTRPGRYRYTVQSQAGLAADPGEDDEDRDDTSVIEVRPGEQRERGRSHALEIRRSGRRMGAAEPKMEVDPGDIVLWHASDSSVAGWTVRGAGPDARFDSRRLEANSLYTHAFGLPGVYEWRDVYGSEIGGRIEVRSPEAREPEEAEKWIAALADGSVITVSGQDVQPRELSILTGQTVFWVIEDAPGIAIVGTPAEEKPDD